MAARDDSRRGMLEALVEIAACPEDHQPLRLAPEALVAHLNALIAARSLRSLSGDLITAALEDGLLRADGLRLYPVREGHAVLLPAEAIALQPEDRVHLDRG